MPWKRAEYLLHCCVLRISSHVDVAVCRVYKGMQRVPNVVIEICRAFWIEMRRQGLRRHRRWSTPGHARMASHQRRSCKALW